MSNLEKSKKIFSEFIDPECTKVHDSGLLYKSKKCCHKDKRLLFDALCVDSHYVLFIFLYVSVNKTIFFYGSLLIFNLF